MKVYKALSFVLHFLMLLFWILTALFFLNLSLNNEFRLYIQKVFVFSDPKSFFVMGMAISCICLILGFVLYRQNRYKTLHLQCSNESTQVSSSFIKDLVAHFFKKHAIVYKQLDVLIYREKLKIFVSAKTVRLELLKKFEGDLSQALSYHIGYTKPFKISFELSES